MPVAEHIPLPVTLLTGFLGSGKTTLLNHLLKHGNGEKIAIIENEFGEVNLDSRLLDHGAEIEIVELTNGCVCCSVRGELAIALRDLLARRDDGRLSFDRLILETTGLADPAPVIQTFFVEDFLRERFQLDAVVTLVDVEHAQRQLDEHRVAVSQIAFADRLLLTKTDRIGSDEKVLLIDRLRKINARAPIVEAQYGRVDRSSWLDLHAFNLDAALTIDEAFIPMQRPTLFSIRQPQRLLQRSWNDNIVSHVLAAGEMDLARAGAWMETLIAEHGNDMLRYKGIFAIAGEPRRLIVQGVHKVVGFDYGPVWQANEERASILVIIGRDLPVERMRQDFDECVFSDAPTSLTTS